MKVASKYVHNKKKEAGKVPFWPENPGKITCARHFFGF